MLRKMMFLMRVQMQYHRRIVREEIQGMLDSLLLMLQTAKVKIILIEKQVQNLKQKPIIKEIILILYLIRVVMTAVQQLRLSQQVSLQQMYLENLKMLRVKWLVRAQSH